MADNLTSVLIDAVRYKVEPTNETLIVDGRECGAMVDFNLGLIKVRKDDVVGDGVRAKILMHEVIHALLHERGLIEASEDEQLADALAAGFVNLIRHNPDLLDFIREGDTDGRKETDETRTV